LCGKVIEAETMGQLEVIKAAISNRMSALLF